MTSMVPKEKLSKKAQKEMNKKRRQVWGFSPVSRRKESKKQYSRKNQPRDNED